MTFQILHNFDSTFDLRLSGNCSLVLLERVSFSVLVHRSRVKISLDTPWYLAREQRSSHLGRQALRQVRHFNNLHNTRLTFTFRNIKAAENKTVAMITFGEGWHNYHHVFPWDYKAAELGNYRMNTTTAFLDLMAKIGWAYDLKTVSVEMINKRVKRTGDGSRLGDAPAEGDDSGHHHHHENSIWGWGDKDMKTDDMELVEIHHQKLPKFVQ
jgi:hypothetical protein